MTRLSIKWRLSLISMGTLTCILLLLTFFVYFSLSKWMNQQEDQAALETARHIALAYPGNVEQGSGNVSRNTQTWIDQFVAKGQYVYLLKPTGQLLASAGKGLATRPDLSTSAVRHIPFVSFVTVDRHRFIRVVTTSHAESGRLAAWVILYESTDLVQGYLDTLVRILIIGSLFGIMLAGASGYFLSVSALRPVAQIIRRVRGIDATSLEQRLSPDPGRDEIAELSRTFNEMLSRISLTIAKQNEFIADASHEFRSPLTVIEGYANLLDRWGKEDPEVMARAVAAIKKEASRLRKLTNGLLQLASLPTARVDKKACDASAVIHEVVTQFADVYQRDIQLHAGNTPVHVAMQSEHLHQIMAILLQNAVKHTPSDRMITVHAGHEHNWAIIAVQDEGAGIPPEHLPFVFDRFYRADQARQRSTEGFGLGLAIARELIGLYGGQIKVISQSGTGTTFRIRLPVGKPAAPGP